MSNWKAQYDKQGYYFPMRVIDADRAAELSRKLASAEARADADTRKLMQMQPSWVLDFVDDLSREAAIVAPVKEILGADVLLWNASLFIKEPRSTSFVSWHQDLTYWGMEESHEVTAWIALSPVTTANGCMKFIPGSHTQNIVEHVETFGENNLLSRGQELAVEVNEEEAVHVELQPGEMSLHHGKLFHGSRTNDTDERRIGLALRYITTGMRQESAEKPFARLIAGEDRFGYYDLKDRTRGVLDPDDIARARENVRIQNAFLFGGDRQEAG